MLGCKMFTTWFRLLVKSDEPSDFIEVLLCSGFELLFDAPCVHFQWFLPFGFVCCHWDPANVVAATHTSSSASSSCFGMARVQSLWTLCWHWIQSSWLKDLSQVSELVTGHSDSHPSEIEFVFDDLEASADKFWPEFRESDAEADCSSSAWSIVGIVVSLFERFGLFVVWWLFLNLLETRLACFEALKHCWQTFCGDWFLFASVIIVSWMIFCSCPKGQFFNMHWCEWRQCFDHSFFDLMSWNCRWQGTSAASRRDQGVASEKLLQAREQKQQCSKSLEVGGAMPFQFQFSKGTCHWIGGFKIVDSWCSCQWLCLWLFELWKRIWAIVPATLTVF